MKKVLFSLSVALTVIAMGTAQARTSSLALSCSSARDLVQRSGAVLFDTGPHTFERIVSSARFCEYDEILEERWIPTADTPHCVAGYKCIPRISITDD